MTGKASSANLKSHECAHGGTIGNSSRFPGGACFLRLLASSRFVVYAFAIVTVHAFAFAYDFLNSFFWGFV